MGCGIRKSGKTLGGREIESLPAYLEYDDINYEMNAFKTNARKRYSSRLLNQNNFWGTVPYYVLSNRIRLLDFEISDQSVMENIFNTVNEILNFFINAPMGKRLKDRKFKCKSFTWIKVYENGAKVIKALGLKVEGNEICVMEGITKDNLIQKVNEVKYAYSTLKDLKLVKKIR